MKITITGISGFVGKNVEEYLQVSHEIFSLGNVRYKTNQKFEINSDALIHLAGKAHDLKKISQPKDYYDANFELTKQLFDAFLESDTEVFIYFSSVKSVADKVQEILFEDADPYPQSIYGQSKLQAEKYILTKEIPQGRRVFIIRPCMIHGPGNKGNLNLLFNLVKKGIPYPLASFHNQRSFLGIDNLNFIIKKILENKEIPSGIYNFADDELLSTNEVVGIISSVLNKKNRSIAIPKIVINTMGKIGDLIKLPLNSETIQKLTENYRVSNQKIKNAIGVEKLPYTAEQNLEKTIKSFINK
jgi:nucleoside-diphosphate-sugar epimerase